MKYYSNTDLNYKKNIKKNFKCAKGLSQSESENIHIEAVYLKRKTYKYVDKLRLLLFNSTDVFNEKMLDAKYTVKERDNFIQTCKILKEEQEKLKKKGISNRLRAFFDTFYRWDLFNQDWDDEDEHEGAYRDQKSTEDSLEKLSKREQKMSTTRKFHKQKLGFMLFLGRIIATLDAVLSDRGLAHYVIEYENYENNQELKDLRTEKKKKKSLENIRNNKFLQPVFNRVFNDSKFRLVPKRQLAAMYRKMNRKKVVIDDINTIERFFEDEDLGGEYLYSEINYLNDVRQNDVHPPFEDNDDIVLKSWFGYFETNYPILFYILKKYNLTKTLDNITKKYNRKKRHVIKLNETVEEQITNIYEELHATGEFFSHYERQNSGLFSKLEPINNLNRLANWIFYNKIFKYLTIQDININIWFIKKSYRFYRYSEDDTTQIKKVFQLYKLNQFKNKLANIFLKKKNEKLLSKSFSFLKTQKQTAGVKLFIGKNLNFLKRMTFKRIFLHKKKRSLLYTPMRRFKPVFARKRKYPVRRKRKSLLRNVRHLSRLESGFFSAFLYLTLPFFLIAGLSGFFSRTKVFNPFKKPSKKKKKTPEVTNTKLSRKERIEKEKREKLEREIEKRREKEIQKMKFVTVVNLIKTFVINDLLKKLLLKNNIYIFRDLFNERWYTFTPHFKTVYLYNKNPFSLSTSWFKNMYKTHFNRKKGFFIKLCFIGFFVLLFLLF